MKKILDDNLFKDIFALVTNDITLFDPINFVDFKIPKDLEQRKQLLNYYLYQPYFFMVWADTMTYAHLNVWKQLINDSDFKFCITAPSKKNKDYDEMGLYNVPFDAWDEGSIQGDFLNSNKNLSALCYFVNKAKNNSFISKYRNQLHVHFHHGDSDKAGSANRIEEIFDYLVVTDSNAVNRYVKADVDIDSKKFAPLGGTIYNGVNVIESKVKIENILYAPTFESSSETINFSSILRAGDHIFSKKTISVRSHHSIGGRDINYKNKIRDICSRTIKLDNNKADQFNWSDAIISDVSDVLSEYLFTNKPIILPISLIDKPWIYQHVIKSGLDQFCYLWDYKMISLDDFLIQIADDPLSDKRLERCNQLYLRLKNYKDSLGIFEETLAMFKLKYKLALQGKSLKNDIDLSKYPIEYKKIIQEIASGKALFV